MTASIKPIQRSVKKRSILHNSKEFEICYGGVSRHLTKASELKKDSESKGKVFLHLNAGGMLGGYVWYQILGAGPAVESIKMLGYNAMALGYRDFEEGVPATVEYLKALKNANVTVLCANMDVSNEPTMRDLFKKSMVINISGRKIGIIGYIGQDADYLADTGKIIFTDPKVAIENEVTALLSQGAYFIIALGSAGFEGVQEWMSKLYNVDLFVNGGSNSFLYNGANVGPLNEKIVGPYPYVDYSQNMKRLFVQTSRYGKYLGKIEMNINDEGRIMEYSTTNPILLDPSVAQNPELQGKVDQWERQVLTQANETIGYTKIPIISDRKICWYEECTGAALMADAARWFLEKITTSSNDWSNTVAATVWHGGALADTDLDLGAGPITYGDILTMFPYANVIVRAWMYGLQIKNLFEESVRYYNDTTSPNRGEFLHVSGLRVEYDLSKPGGLRVANIYIRNTFSIYGGMDPLRLDVLYQIGMPSFIANGGSHFEFMQTVPKNSTGVRDETVLKEYIKRFTPLTYGNEGRVKFIKILDPSTDCPSSNVTGTVFLTIFLTLLFTGLAFAAYKYLWPAMRDRRGSLLSLVR